MECDARFSAEAVAERVFTLAHRNLFRSVGGKADAARNACICVDIALGTAAVSDVDRGRETRGAAPALSAFAGQPSTWMGRRSRIMKNLAGTGLGATNVSVQVNRSLTFSSLTGH